ncbi:MAG: carbohydrate-binding domain-containing protein [Bacteroidaceae bacterium]|nr:carbohydrate-binding domain-containing protein [Bacteroidaceae bacterium]
MHSKYKVLVALCLLLVANSIWAQHNVYINQNVNGYNRVSIFKGIEKMAFGTDSMMVWDNYARSYTFDASAVGTMGFREHDTWLTKVLPEKYHADFDFDITFEESDKKRITAEPEVTDPKSVQYDDFLAHSTWSKTVNIAYNGNEVNITGDTDSLVVTKDGAHLTIQTNAVGIRYILSGNSSDACFKLYSERKACLTLNGINLTNTQGPVINSQSKKRLFIDLPANTVNTLTDATTYKKVKGEDQRGCVFAEGKICISGEGQLYVNAHKKGGIASDDYVHLLGGFVHVNAYAQKGKAIYGKDNVIIGGGVLRTYSEGDASKGISSDSLLWVKGGVIKAITTGDAVYDDAEEDYSSCCGLKSEWDMNISGGEIYCLSTGTGGKGISAGHSEIVSETKTNYLGTLTIADADIYIRTSGKRVPEEKTEDSHGQKVEAAASPKGLKSAGKMTINSGNVYVRCSGGAAAEGIESKKEIYINGGKIRSYSVDDGMNAEGCHIKGGDVMICSTENDGFDVSFLYMYDGLLYTIGGDIDQMGLDTDGKTFKVMSGEILSLGARNCQPYESSDQASVLCYVKGKSISYLALADADDNIIKVIPTPDTYKCVCALFSNSSLQVGNRYKILSFEKSLTDTPATEYDFTLEKKSLQLGSFK